MGMAGVYCTVLMDVRVRIDSSLLVYLLVGEVNDRCCPWSLAPTTQKGLAKGRADLVRGHCKMFDLELSGASNLGPLGNRAVKMSVYAFHHQPF
jgi:hypothetical protein